MKNGGWKAIYTHNVVPGQRDELSVTNLCITLLIERNELGILGFMESCTSPTHSPGSRKTPRMSSDQREGQAMRLIVLFYSKPAEHYKLIILSQH